MQGAKIIKGLKSNMAIIQATLNPLYPKPLNRYITRSLGLENLPRPSDAFLLAWYVS